MDNALPESRVGDLAVAIPGATAVFRKHHIDFCCGGARSLASACAARGVDTGGVVAALEQLLAQRQPAAVDWRTQPLPALLDHIEANFHHKHRRDLPELVRLASRVEHVHADHPACPRGLAAALKETLVALETHMRKEEDILFPMIRRGLGHAAGGPVAVMQAEHEEHGERLRRLEVMAHGLELPPGACNTWRATYAGVRAFIDDVMEHISLENNVLFPRAAG